MREEMHIKFGLSFKVLTTLGYETNPISLRFVYPHVFTFLAFKLKSFITYFTFIHVVIVFVFMPKHSSWSVKVFLTQVAFHQWMYSTEVVI